MMPEQWTEFAEGKVHCPECQEMIPVPVFARVEEDGDGNAILNTRADLAEVWAHTWVHEGESNEAHRVGEDPTAG